MKFFIISIIVLRISYTYTMFVALAFHLLMLKVLSRATTVEGSLATTHLLVTHVGPCDDASDVLMVFDELTITTQTADCLLTGAFNLTKDIADGWKVKATMQKCSDIRNVETCDFLTDFYVVTNGCAEDNDAEEETYNMLFHYVKPDMDCPIQAGVYKLDKYPFFTEDNFLTVYETKISTSVFGYTLNLDGYTVDGQRVFCVEAYLQLIYIREHDWLSAHNKSQLNKYKQTRSTQRIKNFRSHYNSLERT